MEYAIAIAATAARIVSRVQHVETTRQGPPLIADGGRIATIEGSLIHFH
jgi:hypothetical protein